MADFAAVVQRYMTERGMSMRGLAKAAHYDPSTLSKILNGHRPVTPHIAWALDDALGAGGEITAVAAEAPAPLADAEKIRRALEDALADGAMPAATLDDWDSAVDQYGYRTRDTPSPVLLADLTADLADLRLAIGRHRSASALPRLALTAARMSGLVTLLYVKAGDRQAWRRWGRTARHAATEAGDPAALSWATAQESYGYYYAGDMPGAVASARAALDATRAPCVGGALAAALEMRAHAAMGDATAARAAMGTAERIHGALRTGELAASAFGYAESQLRFHAGDALTALGDTSAALPVLDRALELCPAADFTDWAMTRLNQAACTILDGDPDAGLVYATETLTALDVPRRQGVIADRGRALLAALPPAQRASRVGRELRALLDDTTGQRETHA
jgi:plasmid maintenance system antidote protein VapI